MSITGYGIFKVVKNSPKDESLFMFMCAKGLREAEHMATACSMQDRTHNYYAKQIEIEVVKE